MLVHLLVYFFWISLPPLQAITLTYLNDFDYPKKIKIENAEVGGLSGIAYDAVKNRLLAVSDERQSPRLYTFDLKLDPKNFVVKEKEVIFVKDRKGNAVLPQSLDMEGVALSKNGQILVSAEGQLVNKIEPQVWSLKKDGTQDKSFSLPEAFKIGKDKDSQFGVTENASLESLTLSPSEEFLFTALEHPLKEDGPSPTFEKGSLTRILKLAQKEGAYFALAQFAYLLDPVPTLPGLDPKSSQFQYQENGLVDLIALDNHRFLTLERSFSMGNPNESPNNKISANSVRIYEVDFKNALDVSKVKSLGSLKIEKVAKKKLVLDLDSIKQKLKTPRLDNIEGMCLGPIVDNKQTLIFVSDDNFNKDQRTVFIAFYLSDKNR